MRARSRRGGRRRVLRRLAHERWDGSGEDLHRARVESFMETLVDRVDGDPSTGLYLRFRIRTLLVCHSNFGCKIRAERSQVHH